MTDERWQEIKGQIKEKFQVLNERTEELLPEKGQGTVEIIEFIGPLGKMKLERTTQPKILDKRTIGSRRIGSKTKVEYIYSQNEVIHRFTAYRWDENNQVWLEIEIEKDSVF